jgi:hypothetical protein
MKRDTDTARPTPAPPWRMVHVNVGHFVPHGRVRSPGLAESAPVTIAPVGEIPRWRSQGRFNPSPGPAERVVCGAEGMPSLWPSLRLHEAGRLAPAVARWLTDASSTQPTRGV